MMRPATALWVLLASVGCSWSTPPEPPGPFDAPVEPIALLLAADEDDEGPRGVHVRALSQGDDGAQEHLVGWEPTSCLAESSVAVTCDNGVRYVVRDEHGRPVVERIAGGDIPPKVMLR